jgi:hypothetical protein
MLDDTGTVVPRVRVQCDRLRRGFYVLTEHAEDDRLHPSLEEAVIGMLYGVNEGLPAHATDRPDQRPSSHTNTSGASA